MSDPDARPSAPQPAVPDRPGVAPSAPAADAALALRQAARLLAEPLGRLASAVRSAQAHLAEDPDRARGELEQARAAIEALRSELDELVGD